MRVKQPWVKGPAADLIFILFPPFLSVLVIMALPSSVLAANEVTAAWWVALVLFVDVAHVYSTLYRTYFDRDYFREQRLLLLLVPAACWVSGVILYFMGPAVFWTTAAYIAVFHFVRQQYGFMRIYSRTEKQGKAGRLTDSLAIYSATLYPLFFWHFSGDREFHWFLEGDFLLFSVPELVTVAFYIFLALQITYLVRQGYLLINHSYFNVPKNALWAGTVLSWYIGIVVLNGDLTFTLTNVLTHGIPYVALVYFLTPGKSSVISRLPGARLVLFLLPLLVFAFIEEGLWNGLVWRDEEKDILFAGFQLLPQLQANDLLALLVPLLALPQLTHYVLDGFIWKSPRGK